MVEDPAQCISSRISTVMSNVESFLEPNPDRAALMPTLLVLTQGGSSKPQNMQRPPREHLNEPTHEKNSGMGYGDYEFISDLSQSSYSGDGKANDKDARGKRDKPWYQLANIDAASTAGERKGPDVSKAYVHYQEPRSAQTLSQMHLSSNGYHWRLNLTLGGMRKTCVNLIFVLLSLML